MHAFRSTGYEVGPSKLAQGGRQMAPGSLLKMNRAPFITHIVIAWKIPRIRLLVLTDAHYRSMPRVGPSHDFR